MRYLNNQTQYDDINVGLVYPLEVTDCLVLKHLPLWGRGANEDKISHRLPQHDYIDAHYLSVQPSRKVRIAIVIDIDSDLDVELMKTLNLPMPRTITGRHSCEHRCLIRPGNPFQTRRSRLDTHQDHSSRPHLIYWLDRPIFMENKGQAQKYHRICKRLKAALATICKVDAINPPTTKNPAKMEWPSGDPAWHVIHGDNKLWTLDELDDAIRRAKVKYPSKPEKPVHSDTRQKPKYQTSMAQGFREEVAAEGRHLALFETMRFFAYAYKAEARNEGDLFNYTLEQCVKFDALNNKHDPLPFSSIKAIAKSMARWTWRFYTGPQNGKDIGACKRAGLIHAGMSRRTRQQIGGRYGAEKNADKKRQKIIEAIKKLEASGESVVISKLARELEVSRNTLKKYLAEVKENAALKASTDVISETAPRVVKTVPIRIGPSTKATETPQYGAKITAVIGGDTVELWPVIGQEGKVVNKHGVVMPAMYFDGLLQEALEGPEVVEIPSFLL